MPLNDAPVLALLPVLVSFLWIVQLVLLIHVFKTGRPYWWIFVLVFVPAGLGCALYLILEILPSARRPHGGFISGLKPRSWRIRELREQLEETDVVRTRLDLAEELLEAGQNQEARAVAVEALQGVFRDDPHTMVAVARFELAVDRHDEALALLRRIDVKHDRLLENEKMLLEGRAYLGLGDLPRAEERFRYLDGRHVGDEPNYNLGVALLASGRKDEAVHLWEGITKRYRRATPAWRRSERMWYHLARERLEEQQN